MTTDEAMTEMRAARAVLFAASGQRAHLTLARTQLLADLAAANTAVTQARARVAAARLALQAALITNDPAPEVPLPP